MPRLIFNAKTLKLCSKIKFATQVQQNRAVSIRCRMFSVMSELGQKQHFGSTFAASALTSRADVS